MRTFKPTDSCCHFRLTLHSSLARLGALHWVLSKRRDNFLDDSMVGGSKFLSITALNPQAESFGLTPELFRNASGDVPVSQLFFCHLGSAGRGILSDSYKLEEREDFGAVQQAGDTSTWVDNTALQFIC
jgi:ribosome assembly protein 1